MAIDPNLFPIENLVLERLYSNLVESEDTVVLLKDMLVQDIPQEERDKYVARLAEEEDKVVLLKELIKRKRRAEMEKI